MSLSTAVSDLAVRAGVEFKTLRAQVGGWLAAKADDNAVVKLAGDQTISGTKTFISGALVPSPTGPGSAIRNDDTRLTDARAPLAHAAELITSGMLDIARIPTGTASDEVAIGNHSHGGTGGGYHAGPVPSDQGTAPVITHSLGTQGLTVSVREVATGLLVPVAAETVNAAGTLSDDHVRLSFSTAPTAGQYDCVIISGAPLPGVAEHVHPASAITSGSLAYARLPVGVVASTVAAGNDARLTDARTPLSHTHAQADITGLGTDLSAIRTALFGGSARTARSLSVIRQNGNYTQLVNADMWAAAGWVVTTDPDGAVHIGTGGSDYTYWECPLAGRRWDVSYRAAALGAGNAGQSWACKVGLNGRQADPSVATDSQNLTGAYESYLNALRYSVALALGDKLYWSTFSPVSFTVHGVSFGIPTEVVIRDVGPA